ncbi:MAG TPA: MerR family transcriptional regulator [Acidimicrobiales bacterium]|nr:MerR family transcriptional regulator [Acidimicrobiales bacterium]
MSSRTHLSIGDVLTLLREEFPDVTISKIRFLESQGLVNPERSPSGYRKFFAHDVERLRWVLRQQRENFLPLKVIRDRLAEGEPGDPEVGEGVDRQSTGRNGKVVRQAPSRVGSPGLPGAPEAAGGAAVSARTEEQSAKADDEAMARILADASRRSALIPDAATPAALHAVGAAATAAGISPMATTRGDAPRTGAALDVPAGAKAAPVSGALPAASAGRRSAAEPTAPAGTGRAVPADPATAPRGPDAGTTSPGGRSTTGARSAGGTTPAPPATGTVTGASLTAAELCKASGLSEIELAALQGFGLIASVELAGIETFDEGALTVANLAVAFRTYGIEPRHLRLYRNAVDRELGLIEQVIIPLLRQRNPESRQRAIEGAENLGALGQTMRAALLHSALRRHIGG